MKRNINSPDFAINPEGVGTGRDNRRALRDNGSRGTWNHRVNIPVLEEIILKENNKLLALAQASGMSLDLNTVEQKAKTRVRKAVANGISHNATETSLIDLTHEVDILQEVISAKRELLRNPFVNKVEVTRDLNSSEAQLRKLSAKSAQLRADLLRSNMQLPARFQQNPHTPLADE